MWFVELLFEIEVNLLLAIPGAFVRWTFTGFKGSFWNYLKESDVQKNAAVGILLLIVIVVLIAAY